MNKNTRFIALCLGLFLPVSVQAASATVNTRLQIEKLLEDRDHGVAADLVEMTVTVRGVLISQPRLMTNARPSAVNGPTYLSVFYIQDDTAGIRVVSTDKLLITEGYEIGDVLEITGVLRTVSGRPQLVKQSIQRVDAGGRPEPLGVSAAELGLKRFSGRLIRLSGKLVLPETGTQDVVFEDTTGRVSLNIASQIFHDPDFVRSLAQS